MKQLPVLLLLLQCFCLCNAQTNPSGHHFNLLSIKDGMPEGSVLDLLQDKKGYMWIATQKGLVRYDGYKPKVYDFGTKDPYGISVSKLYEDSKGRLWASLLNGLYVYDGAHDNFINCLQWNYKSTSSMQDDAKGNIWLSLYDTLIHYDPVTKRSEGFSNKAKGKYQLNATAFYIYKDKAQRIWVRSNNGLYEYNAKENIFIAHLSHTDSSKQISIGSIQEDAQQPGIFYFDGWRTYPYGNEALCRYNSNTDSLTLFHHKAGDANSIANDTLTGSYTDSKGRLWITSYGGLSLFDALHQNFTNYVPDPVDAFKNAYVNITIKEDKAGNLWCNSNKGLYYFNINTKQFQQDTVDNNVSNGLIDNYAINLFADRSGIIWFGSAQQKGLEWMDTRRSRFIQYGNGASADVFFKGGALNSFTKAPDGSTWMGTANGLYHQSSDGSFKQVQFLPGTAKSISVGGNRIYASKGLICVWKIDPVKPVFYCYDVVNGKTIDISYDPKDTAAFNFYYANSVCKDRLGDIWIGSWGGGICRFNTASKTITRFPFIKNDLTIADTHGALDDDQVECIYEDMEGVIWVGTNNGGLNRFNRDKGIFTSYVGRSPGFNCVVNINEDSKGRLWASTFFGGLFMLNKNRDSIKRFSEKDGLLYDGIGSTVEDNKENIWASTLRGVSVIDPAAGKITNITNINNLAWGNIEKTKEGIFYLATNDGFITLNPDDFAPDKEPPVVHIESVHLTTFIKDKPKDSAIVVDTVKSYKFSHNENRITFNYVGLYYKDPLATQYAYKLDGYDKDWVQAGTQRTITYTNLSPGTYTFHVKAANSDGVWSAGDESIIFSIMPPWWETWWAWLLYAIVFAAAVWAFIAYRSRQLRQSNKILEHKVQVRTAEVMEQKEELTAQKEELAAQRDHLEEALDNLQSTQAQLIQSEKMASLGELTAGIAHEIQNPLNFVNNFSEINKELLIEMKDEMNKGNIDDANAIANDVIDNEGKINHHGKRADAIVKGMLQHSRKSEGKKELTDINALCDEYLRLAYHGLRAKDKSFNTDFKTEFDATLGKLNIVSQDIGRVLLNLYNNAFYAVNEKFTAHRSPLTDDYKPLVSVQTKRINDKVEIIVTDNGNGIPQNIVDKIFQPFFTTKPTGEGTGLGLSLSYDIIKVHGGDVKVKTKEGEGSEFIIQLPVV